MKKILLGSEARQQIKAGIDKCCDTVKVSLGKNGNNVLIYNGQTSEIINDGVSIAREVDVKNEIEQAGIQLAKQCASQTDSDAGDGTTTTLVLLQSILNEIITDFQTEDKRELRDKLFKEANELLKRINPKQIKTKKDLYNLALTSSLDDKIAEVISDIYDELGKDAKVSVEEVSGDVLEANIVKGIQFESKPAESKLFNEFQKEVYEGIHILVSNEPTMDEIQKKITHAINEDKTQLIVIGNKFSEKVLLSTRTTKNFDIIPVTYAQIRTIGDVKDFVGDKPADKVIIEKDRVTIIGGKGDIDKKVGLLKDKRAKEQSDYEKEEIDKRIGNLTGGIAQIKIGKATDVERIETVLKIEDALGAIKGSYELGYVTGGGIALSEASKQCSNTKEGEIMKKVCTAPFLLISETTPNISETVIDSFKTVKHSLLNALSTATSVLTVEAALIEENEDE